MTCEWEQHENSTREEMEAICSKIASDHAANQNQASPPLLRSVFRKQSHEVASEVYYLWSGSIQASRTQPGSK